MIITGPADEYRLTYSARFLSSTKIQVEVKNIDPVFGNSVEIMKITLVKSKFLSLIDEEVSNNVVEAHPYQMIENESLLSSASAATTSVLAITMGIIISSNILL